MKYILISILSIVLLSDPGKIGKINSVKSEARKAFTAGDYKKAIEKYKYLIDSLEVNEDEVTLNLASAYYMLKDTANANTYYNTAANSDKSIVSSKAHQQLGVMSDRQGRLEEALDHFKQAIKADPRNDDARYNYEMLKKKLDEKKKQDQKKQDQNKDQKKDDQKKDKNDQNKDQKDKDKKEQEKKDQEKKDQEKKDQEKKDQEKKDQDKKDDKKDDKDKDKQKSEQDKKDEQEKKDQEKKDQQEQNEDKDKKDKPDKNLNKEKLQQMQITEEKAKMILEAMKNQEKQYLQQNKRKATKQKDKSKPDW